MLNLILDPWLPRYLHGMALPNPHASGHGFASRRTRLPRLRPNGEYIDRNQPNSEKKHQLMKIQDAPDDYNLYSHKRCADDIKALASHLGESKVILGGHDW